MTQMQDSTLVGFPGPVLFLFSLNMRQTSLGLSLATRDKGMSSISGARCLLGARGPSLEEGEGHRRLLFLSLPPLALAPEETSAEEGTTRPSRGQCDAGHVLPPAVLVSSISLVTSHSVDGELRPVPPPLRSRLSLPGWENPAPGRVSSTCPCPLLQPTHRLRPWSFNSCPSNGQPTSGPVDPGAVRAPPPLLPREGSLPLRPIRFVFHVATV